MIPRSLLATIAFSAGLFVGLLIAPAVSASRPAAQPVVPAASDAARGGQRTGAPTLTPAQRPGNTGGVPSHDPIGGATPGVTGANDTAAGPTPAAAAGNPPQELRPTPSGASAPATLRGQASWVRASLGSHYLAARMPRGTVLRITGPLGSVVRVVTDFGPSAKAFPERVVDLSTDSFRRICGPLSSGVCPVSVAVR